MPPAESGSDDPGFHWILLLHVDGLGERPESVQSEVRDALDTYVRLALTDAKIREKACTLRERDSGLALLVPPSEGPATLLRDFVRALTDHLNGHDDRYRASHRLALRLGMHYGTVTVSKGYWACRALFQLARLLDRPPADWDRGRSGVLVVLSDAVHWAVVRAGCRGVRQSDYAPIEVPGGDAEGRALLGWVTVAGQAGPPPWATPPPEDVREEGHGRPERPAAHGRVPAPPRSAVLPEPTMLPESPADGSLFHPDFRLGGGGQGVVYAVMREIPGIRVPLAYKEYRPGQQLDFQVLDDMVRFFGDLERDAPADHAFLESRLAWPLRLGRRGGSAKGFLMRQVPPEFMLNGPGMEWVKPQALEFLLNPDDYLRRLGLSVDDEQRLLLLKDLAGILCALHQHDIVVGDLSPKNILFRMDIWPRCFLIDCDSMRFRGRDVLPQVDTPGWAVPEPQRATRASDVHKLGLLALRLFNRDQEDEDEAGLMRQSAELAALAGRSLAKEPAERPTTAEWLDVLDKTIDCAKPHYSGVDVDAI